MLANKQESVNVLNLKKVLLAIEGINYDLNLNTGLS